VNNTVKPIRDAYGRVVDFIVEHECEGCKRRKLMLKKVARSVRDRMRNPRGKKNVAVD
jgi:hypothetical protein